jgi:hypothetical protein
VLEAGDASPNGVVQFSVPGTSSIYPSVWHAFNTLVLPVVDVSVVTASNAAFIVTACLVWPLSVLVLTRAAFGRAPAVTISAGVIGAGVATFPLFLITDIGAYPLVLSTSVLPVAIGSALAVAFTQPSSPSRPVALLLLLGVVPGIVATHPSSLHAMAFLSLPVAIVFVVRWSRSHSRWRIAAFAAFAAFALLVLLLSLEVRPAFQKNPTIESFPEALIAIATLGIAEFPAAPLVALMSVIGAIAAIRSRDARQLSVVGMWIVGLGLYVVAASGDELTRSILTGGWYRDPMRLAALAAVTVVPLAAHGSATVWGWMRSVVGNRAPALVRVLGAFATVGLIVGTQGAAMRTVEEWTAQSFTPAEHADGVRVPLGNDARELFERVPNIVPKGEVIVGDPKDGSSFLYALTGWRVLLPHLLTPRTPEITALLDGLATSTPQGPACVAARDLELRWVLVTRERTPEDLEPGLLGLENSPNVELVDSEGGARLYRITGCGS